MFPALFGQEVRDNGRKVAIVIGGALLVTAVSTAIAFLNIPVLTEILMLLIMGAAIAMPTGMLIVLGIAYWQSMYGARGYFTHTLPVRGRALYFAKTVFAYLATLLAFVGAALAVFAFVSIVAMKADTSVAEVVRPLREAFSAMRTWQLVFIVGAMFLALANTIFPSAAVMSIGAEGRWNRLGIGAPIVGFVLLYLVNQITAFFAVLFIPGSIELSTGEFTWSTMLPDFIEAVKSGEQAHRLGLGMVPMSLIVTCVVAFWGIRSIEKRTSLR